MVNNTIQIKTKELEQAIREKFSTAKVILAFENQDYNDYKIFFENPKIKKILENSDMVYSVMQFLANDLNISSASRKSYLHRNTIVYRIEKLKKSVGLDIRKFNDAVLMNNMIEVKSILDSQSGIEN